VSVVARARVRVPASTSNLGPGFDCLGLALGLYNELTLELHDEPGDVVVQIEGEGAKTLPRDKTNLIVKAAKKVLPPDAAGRKLVFKSVNCIPTGRGLGSSAAAILAGLFGANHLVRPQLHKREELIDLACEMEGHPDNVTAAALGGLVVCADGQAYPLKPHPKLAAVVCSPDFELSTAKSRKAVPKKFSREDAVFNAARALLLGSAIERGDWARLGVAMEDRLHQPYRAKLVPGLEDVIAAARDAGSCGASLSGAGPSVVALCQSGLRAVLVGKRMKEAFQKKGVKSNSLVLNCDAAGVVVEN
jgi:homoserine kinase